MVSSVIQFGLQALARALSGPYSELTGVAVWGYGEPFESRLHVLKQRSKAHRLKCSRACFALVMQKHRQLALPRRYHDREVQGRSLVQVRRRSDPSAGPQTQCLVSSLVGTRSSAPT